MEAIAKRYGIPRSWSESQAPFPTQLPRDFVALAERFREAKQVEDAFEKTAIPEAFLGWKDGAYAPTHPNSLRVAREIAEADDWRSIRGPYDDILDREDGRDELEESLKLLDAASLYEVQEGDLRLAESDLLLGARIVRRLRYCRTMQGQYIRVECEDKWRSACLKVIARAPGKFERRLLIESESFPEPDWEPVVAADSLRLYKQATEGLDQVDWSFGGYFVMMNALRDFWGPTFLEAQGQSLVALGSKDPKRILKALDREDQLGDGRSSQAILADLLLRTTDQAFTLTQWARKSRENFAGGVLRLFVKSGKAFGKAQSRLVY